MIHWWDVIKPMGEGNLDIKLNSQKIKKQKLKDAKIFSVNSQSGIITEKQIVNVNIGYIIKFSKTDDLQLNSLWFVKISNEN